MAITFIVAVVYIAINFLVDMSYAFLDPRAVKR
jgi:ABC-type dipeptide/oligopeptide/nickel transport system permease component